MIIRGIMIGIGFMILLAIIILTLANYSKFYKYELNTFQEVLWVLGIIITVLSGMVVAACVLFLIGAGITALYQNAYKIENKIKTNFTIYKNKRAAKKASTGALSMSDRQAGGLSIK